MSVRLSSDDNVSKILAWSLSAFVFLGAGLMAFEGLQNLSHWFGAFLGDPRLFSAVLLGLFIAVAVMTYLRTAAVNRNDDISFENVLEDSDIDFKKSHVFINGLAALFAVSGYLLVDLLMVRAGWINLVSREWAVVTSVALGLAMSLMARWVLLENRYSASLYISNSRKQFRKQITPVLIGLLFSFMAYGFPLSDAVLNILMGAAGSLAMAYITGRVAYRIIEQYPGDRFENEIPTQKENNVTNYEMFLKVAAVLLPLCLIGPFVGFVAYYGLERVFSSLLPASMMEAAFPLSVALAVGLGLFASLFSFVRLVVSLETFVFTLEEDTKKNQANYLLDATLTTKIKAFVVILAGVGVTFTSGYLGFSFLARQMGLETVGWTQWGVIALALSVAVTLLPVYAMNAVNYVKKDKFENQRPPSWLAESFHDFIRTEQGVSAVCATSLGIMMSFVLSAALFGEGLYPLSVGSIVAGSLMALWVGYGRWANATEFAHVGDPLLTRNSMKPGEMRDLVWTKEYKDSQYKASQRSVRGPTKP